jgi:hypothetical protein
MLKGNRIEEDGEIFDPPVQSIGFFHLLPSA